MWLFIAFCSFGDQCRLCVSPSLILMVPMGAMGYYLCEGTVLLHHRLVTQNEDLLQIHLPVLRTVMPSPLNHDSSRSACQL